MREIKFRVWDKKQKVMDYDCRRLVLMLNGLICYRDDRSLEMREYAQNTFVLIEYTGCKDSKFQKIFEGDILRFMQSHEEGCECGHCFPLCRKGTICVVKFVDDGFMILPQYHFESGICEACSSLGRLYSSNHEIPIGAYAEIIGNVWENPELLEGKNEH